MTANGKQPLIEIEKLLKRFRESLAQAAETIRTENVSNYPIFVASKSALEIGIPLMLHGELADDWTINASTLEEFHVRRIIATEKIDDFRDLYRSKKDELCVFVLLPNYVDDSAQVDARFIFIPF